MKRFFAIILSVLVLVSLCACSGSKDVSVDGTVWVLSGVNFDGIEVNGTEQLASYGIDGRISFSGDQFSLVLLNEEQTGSYTQKSDIITLTDGSGNALFAVMDEGTLIIEDQDVGTLYFTIH